jgi:hypothetical protein
MNGLCLSVCLSLTLQLQAETASSAIRLETLKSRWSEAWASVRTLHAKVRHFEYDSDWPSVRRSEGTVAFEVNGRCKIALLPTRTSAATVVVRGAKYDELDAQPLTIAWKGDEVINIDRERRVYACYSIADCQRVKKEFRGHRTFEPVSGGILMAPLVNWNNFFQALSTGFMAPLAMMASPADTLPILLSDPASVESAGFELTASKEHPRGLTAVPTTPATQAQVDRINILFGEDGLPYATNMIARDGRRNVVHVLHEIRINDVSPAAQAEFAPVLDGLVREVWPEVTE